MLERLLAKRHISHLNLSSVRTKLFEKSGWTPTKAAAVEIEYKRFLYALTHKSPGQLIAPPSTDVDEFWHQHILDTRKYREDCQTVFGHYVDHTPGLSAEEQAKADAARRKVYSDNDIGSMSFGSGEPSGSGDSATFTGCGGGGSEPVHSHGSHTSDSGHHGSGHGADSGGHDGGGHGGGDSSGGDGGGGDGGGGCSGGGGCGGGCGS